MSKLQDKKINTLVEVRMQEISKQEIAKSRVLLTSRKHLFHNYSATTNVFSPLMEGQFDTSKIGWEGRTVELSNIQQSDVDFSIRLGQSNDPATGGDETAHGDGAGLGAMTKNLQGRRVGNIIQIQSVSANVRVRGLKLDYNVTNNDNINKVMVHYAFVLWRDEEIIMSDPATIPDPNQLLNQPYPWDYVSKIDLSLEQEFNGLKTRVLCSGKTQVTLNRNRTDEKFTAIFKKFKKPITIQYDPQSQNGQKCNQKLIFVCRSTCPDNQTAYLPSVHVLTKVNYFE